jgi:hypothetical protein
LPSSLSNSEIQGPNGCEDDNTVVLGCDAMYVDTAVSGKHTVTIFRALTCHIFKRFIPSYNDSVL